MKLNKIIKDIFTIRQKAVVNHGYASNVKVIARNTQGKIVSAMRAITELLLPVEFVIQTFLWFTNNQPINN